VSFGGHLALDERLLRAVAWGVLLLFFLLHTPCHGGLPY